MPIGVGTGLAVAGGVGALGSIGSALIGSDAAKRAGELQANAANQALAFQKQVYDQNQTYAKPYIDTGNAAGTSLAKLYGLTTPGNPGGAQGVNEAFNAFTNLPAYQFPLQQGMLALTRNLNAQGLNMSGAQSKEAQQYGQGLASQYMMSNYVSPLQSLYNVGANASSSLASTNAGLANTVGQTQMGVGQAQASGAVGSANALSAGVQGAANNIGGNLSLYSLLSRNGGAPTQNPTGGNPVGGGLSSYTTVYGGAGNYGVPTFPG